MSLLLLFICLCECFSCGIALFVSELSVSYPPCVRIVVQASDVVDVGTFFLVPCTGGTIGRDKDPRHVIQIQDINMSKVCCPVLIVIDYLWHPISFKRLRAQSTYSDILIHSFHHTHALMDAHTHTHAPSPPPQHTHTLQIHA